MFGPRGLFFARASHAASFASTAAQQSADRAQGKASQIENELHALELRVDRLALACQALWELLRDNTQFEETHIAEKMDEIDMRDGKADGRMASRVMQCPECGRNSNSRRFGCIYCGADMAQGGKHVFE